MRPPWPIDPFTGEPLPPLPEIPRPQGVVVEPRPEAENREHRTKEKQPSPDMYRPVTPGAQMGREAYRGNRRSRDSEDERERRRAYRGTHRLPPQEIHEGPTPSMPNPRSRLADMPLNEVLNTLGADRQKLQRRLEACEAQLMTLLRDSAMTTSPAERARLSEKIRTARSCVEEYKSKLAEVDQKIKTYKYYAQIAPNGDKSKLSDACTAIQRALESERETMRAILREMERETQKMYQLSEKAEQEFEDFKMEIINSVATIAVGLSSIRLQIQKRKTDILNPELTGRGKEALIMLEKAEKHFEQLSRRYERIEKGVELMENTVRAVRMAAIAADIFPKIKEMLESGVLSEEEAKELEKDMREGIDLIKEWIKDENLQTLVKLASNYRGIVGSIAQRWPAIQGLMSAAKTGISIIKVYDIADDQTKTYATLSEKMLELYIRRENVEKYRRMLKECEQHLKGD